MVQERATTVMRDETCVQERYKCVDCSVWGIPKLNIKETRYLPNPCELNSRNTDGQISQAKERARRTYLARCYAQQDRPNIRER